MSRSRLLLASLASLLLAAPAAAAWPGWPNGVPAFRAPATLIDAMPGDLADYQQVLEVVTGDIDGNGLPDLCVRYSDSTATLPATYKLAFVMNHKEPGGPGLMSWPKSMPGYVPIGGAGPEGVQLGDLNKDGRADVVTFNSALGIIRVQLSNGGGLKPPSDYPVLLQQFMHQIQIADRNNDGFPDLYVRYLDTSTQPTHTEMVGFMLNSGTGTFSGHPGTNWFGPAAVSMKIARSGGDLYPEIFVNTNHSVEMCWTDTEFGYTGATTVFDVGIDVYDFAVGRLDTDPYPDLAVLGSVGGGEPRMYVCFGSVNGGFGAPSNPYIPPFGSNRLAIHDMDGDGIGEIYVSIPLPTPMGTVQVLDWRSQTSSNNIYLAPGLYPGPCVFDDLDGDLNPDLIVGLNGSRDHNVAIIQDTGNRGVQLNPIGGTILTYVGSPAVADFNRDGVPDVAIPIDNQTYIQLGQGAERFYTQSTTPAWWGERTYSVDLNRDSKPDLVSSGDDFGYDAFRFQLGNGDGTFQTPQVFSANALLPRHPFDDFDRDGIQDFVYYNKLGMVVGVALGDGAGMISGVVYGELYGLASRPEDVAISDLDRDGDLDLAVATQAGVQLVVNTGTGLALGPIWDSGRDYKTITAGDLDRDGKPDVIAQERIGAPYDRRTRGIQIFYGNGAMGVARRDSVGANERYGEMLEISDVNRDGRPDIVNAAYDDALELNGGYAATAAGVLLQTSTGGFAQRLDYAQGFVQPGGFALLVDATGDKQPDIVSMNRGSNGVTSAPCQISPSTAAAGGWGTNGQTDYTGTVNPLGLAWGDMNRDGKPDLVAADQAGGIFVYFGDGNGGLSMPPYSVPTSACDDVALADLNRDGRLDVFAAGENGRVIVLLGQGDGALTAPVEYNGAGGGLHRIETADLNRDGKPDVVALGDGWGASVFLGGNNGGLFLSQSLALGGPGVDFQLADLNRDGILDMAFLTNFNGPAVYTAMGNGSGAFNPPTSPWSLGQSEGWPYALAIADVNGDGRQDIAADFATPDGEVVYLLHGDGTGGFPGYSTYPSVSEDHYMGFADLDGDPSPDLVMSSYEGVAVRLSNGRGGLGPLQYNAGYASGPGGFAVVDLDRDGMNDLVITDTPNGNVSVVINNKSSITAVADAPRAPRPTLAQNAPNPFNPRTTITFTMAQAGPATLAVYDVQGRQVATLVDSKLAAGTHRVDWDGRTESGEPAASGVYFYRLEAGARTLSKRMVLLK